MSDANKKFKRAFFTAALAAALCLSAGFASGAEAEEDSSFFKAIEFSGGTQFPLTVGGRMTLEFPVGIQLTAQLGYVPKAYVQTISSALVGLGAYDENTGTIVEESLSNSLQASFLFGWSPFAPGGLYLDFGYSLMTLGGDVSGKSILQQVFTKNKTLLALMKDETVPISSTLHNIQFDVGYKIILVDHFLLAFSVGFFKTIGSNTTADIVLPTITGMTEAQRAAKEKYLKSEVNGYMDEIYKKYVISPTFSAWIGFRI